jgi:hypothetical protein
MRIAAALAVLLALPLNAQPYEAVITGRTGFCSPIIPFIVEVLQWVGEGSTMESNQADAIAPAGQGRLYAVDDADVYEISRGAPRRRIASLPRPELRGMDLTVDRAGNIYVRATDRSEDYLVAFDPTGGLRAVHPLGSGYSSLGAGRRGLLDLAADQCTLFLTRYNQIVRRFNVCTASFGPDFATVWLADDLRILPDGGVLVATARSGRLFWYDAAGNLTRTHELELDDEATTVGLARQGSVAWLTGTGCHGGSLLRIFDLESRTIVETHLTGIDEVSSIVPYDSWTAALGPAHAGTDVPAASTYALIALAAILSLLAVRKL